MSGTKFLDRFGELLIMLVSVGNNIYDLKRFNTIFLLKRYQRIIKDISKA